VNVEPWKQANAIYVELMNLTVSDALNRLSQIEIDDEIKSLVLTLISTGSESSQYFNQHVAANFNFETPFQEIHQSIYKVGDEIGGYELQTELGVGGMAKVYQAKKTDSESQKPVAIKLFNYPSLSTVMLDRFAVEQQVLSNLSHANIVNMHHSGSTEEGIPYMVMELIEGGTDIDEYAQSRQVPLRQKIKWVVDAAKAIAYAHNNLIIHRDIKPSNILIDKHQQLKVVDFGIAKSLSKVDEPQKTTIMALTPSFAAPEQINSGLISVTTDVFSLAAVCLDLLIDGSPLPADRLLKSCAKDEVHITQTLRQGVNDQDLRNILNQALQQNPQKRYRNMDAFADDLCAWLDERPVQATPDSWWYRITKFANRRRALFFVLMILMLTVGLSIVLLTWQYQQTLEEVKKTTQVKNFMLDVFEVTHPDVSQGQALSAVDLLRKARINIDKTAQNQPELKAELLLAIGTAFFQVGDWEEAKNTLTEAYALLSDDQEIVIAYAEVLVALKQSEAVNLLLEKHPNMLRTANKKSAQLMRLLAGVDILNDNYQSAKDQLVEAQVIDSKKKNHVSAVKTSIEQANLALLQSEFKLGIEQAQLAIEKYAPEFPPTDSGILRLNNALSVLYTKIGEFEQSQAILEDMLVLQKQHLGDQHPDLVQSMIHLSESYYSQGKLDQAKDISTQAHDLAVKKFGEVHPKLIETLNALATVVFVQGDYKQALILMEEAIGISVDSLGEAHIETSKLQRNYATALGALRRNEEAKGVLLSVLQQQQQTLGESHTDTLYTQISTVRVLSALGEHQQAIRYAEAARDVFEAEPERLGPIKSNTMYALGFAYFEAEQYELAIETFKTIDNENIEATQTANYMVLTKTLARSYLAIKQYENALIYAQKSIALSEQLIGAEHVRTIKAQLLLAEILVLNKRQNQAQRLLNELNISVGAIEHPDREDMLSRIDELLQQNIKLFFVVITWVIMMLFSYDFMAMQLNQKNVEKQQSIGAGSYHFKANNLKLEDVVDSFDQHWISFGEGILATNVNPEISIELGDFTVMPSIHQSLQLSLNIDKVLDGYFRVEFSNQKTFSFYHSSKLSNHQLKAPLDLSKLTWTSSYPKKAESKRQQVNWSEMESLDALVIRFYGVGLNELVLTDVMVEQSKQSKLAKQKAMCNQAIKLLCFVTNRMRFNDNQIQSTQDVVATEHQVITTFAPWVWLLAAWLTSIFILKICAVQNAYAYILISVIFLAVLTVHQYWIIDHANYFRWPLIFCFMALLWFKRTCLVPPKNRAKGLLVGTSVAALAMLVFNGKADFLVYLPAYLLWALVQQALLGPVFSDHLQKQFKAPEWLTACFVGVLFSIIHAPNHMLMLATLVAGVTWSLAWLKYKNIYANALSHALLALILYQVMPEAWLGSARIGIFF